MQTFVTANAWGCCPAHERNSGVDVAKSTAAVLDPSRLGKQRVETKQIYSSLEATRLGGVGGWANHPATKMWEGHLEALAFYGATMCREWKRRGYEDSLEEWFTERYSWLNFEQQRNGQPAGHGMFPWWFGHPEMVESHRSKLIRKLPAYYEKLVWGGGLWADEQYAMTNDLPYLWPTPHKGQLPCDPICEAFYLSGAEYKRKDWDVPAHWKVQEDRKVVFG